uniref:Methylthioribose-1-phosphate isomerase n=1 Tax=Lotharella oceanica TaxID=641309 RepID=A0A7S2TGR1_9EUKA|mmetsp:Transcript_1079/g.2040  ORF Transcript_1079/g.2040 Transcript_1079/m.2040 type:complete len:388 (+) Transcript_1079:52-1215(+)
MGDVVTDSMEKKAKFYRSVYWDGDYKTGKLFMVDQPKLPASFETITCEDAAAVAKCIKTMVVRGAPAIGAAGSYGMYLAVKEGTYAKGKDVVEALKKAKAMLDASRPTAVNLSWATKRILDLIEANANAKPDELKKLVWEEATQICDEDVAINKRLGKFGADLIPGGTPDKPTNLLHHCNTGRLATVDYGTALGIIYTLQEQKKNIHVFVDETRPRLQGARLTAWELQQAGIPQHLICDSSSGFLMRKGMIDVCVFGADRVTANGDVANKIGTYMLSIAAKENNVKVYCACPTSTIDLSLKSGDDIEIEQRGKDEVTGLTIDATKGQIAPTGVPVTNYAFDVTPAKYLTAIVTEEMVCYPPFEKSLPEAVAKAKARLASSRAEKKSA